MTIDELCTAFASFEASIRDKGYNRVEIRAFVESTRVWYSIEYYMNSSDTYNDAIRSHHDDLPKLTAYIKAIPDRLDVMREKFLSRLATLVEDAESLEINIPELRPLFETYRSNLLEHHQ